MIYVASILTAVWIGGIIGIVSTVVFAAIVAGRRKG